MNQERWTAVDGYLSDLLVAPDESLEAALRASAAGGLPAIQVAANQGKLLHLLARLKEARTILEVGTLGGYRRRGIGTHLIARALEAHRDAGFDRAALDVDGESDIGGLAIYARLGFRVARKRTSFVRLLPQRGT